MAQTKIRQGILPKVAIATLISSAAESMFGSSWQPRVVRQQRQIQGSLNTVDYAVPCFELAQKNLLSPADVAIKLTEFLTDNPLAADVDIEYKVEAVSGYVNFQLSDASIAAAVKTATAWYKNPTPYYALHSRNTCVVFGMGIYGDVALDTTDRAFAYIQDIYQVLGVHTKAQYIIDDHTEELVKFLHGMVIADKNFSKIEQIRLYSEIRNFITSYPKPGRPSALARVLKDIRASWIDGRNIQISRRFINKYKNIFMSSQARPVHVFLNAQNDNESIFLDPQSSAAYYIIGEDMMPLRSAGGVLYPMAFVLYNLNVSIHRAMTSNDEALIVLGSHKMSLAISENINLLVGQAENKDRVRYFDPRASKASLLEIETEVPSTKVHFNTIAHALSMVSFATLSNHEKRLSLLTLLDMPAEISEYAALLHIPNLFDAISQSNDALKQLSS